MRSCFLSENPHFVRRCNREGIIFIGPSPQTMDMMGDKISARKQMIKAGVPVVPGTEKGLRSVDEAI
jgi:acetyl-CoA carboxylase biotin carboxylase subunit